MKNLFDLTGKVAIVTGGYGYLGSAMVEVLAAFNAQVIVAGRSQNKCEERFPKSSFPNVTFFALDIRESSDFTKLFKWTRESFGSIDIVINNAFSSKGNSPEKMTDEEWAYTLEGNLASIHKSIREVIPYMRDQQSGKIINISSMYGMVSPDFSVYEGGGCEPYLNPPHYGASKAALLQLTKYYATYLGKDNIQVNAISPGPFPSTGVQGNQEFVNRLSAKTALTKVGKPEDLAGVTLLLSSSASNFITGQNMVVDGGWTVR